MKKILFFTFAVLALSSCTKTWEYKTIVIDGITVTKFSTSQLALPDSTLNLMGKEGWELTANYTTIETVHPNLGNEEYVNGLQPNVRTNFVFFVFKRKN